ncbi:MAG: DUF1818 family protein [Leptolyngbyaceae cyanobacterium SM1_1_3]|nr:DUF1818 family protein [Leptolyngbyaceae cyanobacterium SM1_1_3]NJM85725.1 DUF1818 family protein [Leptolyngbyaceae cyanobacterium RM2_2_21]NJN04933.1 DUF1818 family protein [Leptolyngbyaceae cyanobacterium RM1_1_2]NJO11743.1 DUF1818 family protein [Leptolyngbyaceae cyanobacterium SL_1_1]
MRQIKAGSGWRLGWNPEAQQFCGLVAGEHWAFELTEPELNDFCRLTLQLAATLQQMAGELMAQERITCEAESELIWLEVEGYPQSYSLRFILLLGRGAEGFWPAIATAEVIRAIPGLRLF